MLKRSWVEIDLNLIKKNYLAYKNTLKPNQSVMAVVKADAYGHGDAKVALALQEVGVSHFAVTTFEEALRLKNAGVKGTILIFGYTPNENLDELVRNDLTQAVFGEEYAEEISKAGLPVKVQFALDTGMNRVGLDADSPTLCAETIRKYAKTMNVTGIFTHLCVADSNDEAHKKFTAVQLKKFSDVFASLKDLNLEYYHALNTAGGIWHNDGTSNLARVGIALYGLQPNGANPLPISISPVLAWKSTIYMLKTLKPGEYVGYGLSYKAEKEIKVATVSTGYADGYNRLLSNKGKVLVRGKFAPIIGKICMDQFMIDVTDIPNVKLYDEVTLIGEKYTAEDMALDLGTIGYEVICNISKRVERIYK